MSIEAMKQALEAICGSGDFLFNWHDCEPNNERETQAYQAALANNEKAFIALRQAIEQAEQTGCDHCAHPLYAGTKCKNCGRVTEQAQPVAFEIRAFNATQALVKRADVAQEKAEALERGFGSEADVTIVPLYTAPPPRQPLTDEQIEKIIKANMMLSINFAGIKHDIDEAAHGIKENT